MNSLFPKISLAMALSAAALTTLPAHAESQAMHAAEMRQMHETFTRKAEYQLSRREAYAAYQDAMKACGHQGRTEHASCMRNAKSHLHQDIAYAERHYGHGASMMGASGTTGNTASGSDAHRH